MFRLIGPSFSSLAHRANCSRESWQPLREARGGRFYLACGVRIVWLVNLEKRANPSRTQAFALPVSPRDSSFQPSGAALSSNRV